MRTKVLLFAVCGFVAGCLAMSRGQGSNPEALTIECLSATGIYNTTNHTIDLHLQLRMRSESASPVVVYRLWEAIQADPVEKFVHWLPVASDLRPKMKGSERITIDAKGADVDWVILSWAGMRPSDLQRPSITARLKYQVGETTSNTIKAEVQIIRKNEIRR